MRIVGAYCYPEKHVMDKLLNKLGSTFDELDNLTDLFQKNIDNMGEEHALSHLTIFSDEYPFYSYNYIYGDTVMAVDKYIECLKEKIVEGSNEKRYVVDEENIVITGPLSRLMIHGNKLLGSTREWVRERGLNIINNIYALPLARIIEIYDSLTQIVDYLENYKKPYLTHVEARLSDGVYEGLVEAPRGVLYHRYVLVGKLIKEALIITPTQININAMERLPNHVLLNTSCEEFYIKSSVIVRLLDPCLSCSVHLIKN